MRQVFQKNCLNTYPAVDLLGLKGTVTIVKYKEKKGEVVITDGKLKFTIGGLKEDIIV